MKNRECYKASMPFKKALALYLFIFALSGSIASAQQNLSIKGNDGKVVADIFFDADTKIQYNKNLITGKVKEHGTVKYFLPALGRSIKVKSNQSGFKLKTDDNLLWKTKFKKNKITISNNEENKMPCILKPESPDILRIYEDERLVGTVNGASDAIITATGLTTSTTWKANIKVPSAAGGVMACEKIPELEKFVIMAELIRAGK